MINIICVLRSGGDYDGDYVFRLHHMIKDNMRRKDFVFLCYTDLYKSERLTMLDELPVEKIPLVRNYPGWWSKVEIFRSVGKCLYFDLDTVILKDISFIIDVVDNELEENECVGIRAFNPIRNKNPETEFNSGMIAWNGDLRYIFDEFDYERDSCNKMFCGDQDYIHLKLREKKKKVYFWQDVIDGLYSYKRHIKPSGSRLPDDARIVCFHGHPRPHEITELPWISNLFIKKQEE